MKILLFFTFLIAFTNANPIFEWNGMKKQHAINFSSGTGLNAENVATTFSCDGRSYGYYADVENKCEIFHICKTSGDIIEQFSFFCPAETIFDQSKLACIEKMNANECVEATKFSDTIELDRAERVKRQKEPVDAVKVQTDVKGNAQQKFVEQVKSGQKSNEEIELKEETSEEEEEEIAANTTTEAHVQEENEVADVEVEKKLVEEEIQTEKAIVEEEEVEVNTTETHIQQKPDEVLEQTKQVEPVEIKSTLDQIEATGVKEQTVVTDIKGHNEQKLDVEDLDSIKEESVKGNVEQKSVEVVKTEDVEHQEKVVDVKTVQKPVDSVPIAPKEQTKQVELIETKSANSHIEPVEAQQEQIKVEKLRKSHFKPAEIVEEKQEEITQIKSNEKLDERKSVEMVEVKQKSEQKEVKNVEDNVQVDQVDEVKHVKGQMPFEEKSHFSVQTKVKPSPIVPYHSSGIKGHFSKSHHHYYHHQHGIRRHNCKERRQKKKTISIPRLFLLPRFFYF